MTSLREIQDPLKAQYRDDPTAARVTLSASGRLGEGRHVLGRHRTRAGRGRPAPRDRRRRHRAVLGRHAARGAGGVRRGHAARGGDLARARGPRRHGARRGRPRLPGHARRREGRTGRVHRHPADLRTRHVRLARRAGHPAETDRALLRGAAVARQLAHRLDQHRSPGDLLRPGSGSGWGRLVLAPRRAAARGRRARRDGRRHQGGRPGAGAARVRRPRRSRCRGRDVRRARTARAGIVLVGQSMGAFTVPVVALRRRPIDVDRVDQPDDPGRRERRRAPGGPPPGNPRRGPPTTRRPAGARPSTRRRTSCTTFPRTSWPTRPGESAGSVRHPVRAARPNSTSGRRTSRSTSCSGATTASSRSSSRCAWLATGSGSRPTSSTAATWWRWPTRRESPPG